MTTSRQLQDVLAQRFGLEPREVAPERSLQSLGIDSLAAMELLFDIESRFGIELPPDRARIVTFGDLVTVVDEQLLEDALDDPDSV